jgi:heme oxygenase
MALTVSRDETHDVAARPGPGPNLRASLRAATQRLHRDLDQRVTDLDLADPSQYRKFLRAAAAALIGIEALLERAGVELLLPDWPQRRRTPAILADLRALGVASTPYELRRMNPTMAEMFGILYVLEGSRLGSRVLLERAMSSPDATVRAASTYLTAGTPQLWLSFLRTLEGAGETVDGPEAIAGATYAFAIFGRSFATAVPG